MAEVPKTRIIESGGREIAVCEYGDPNGIPLVQMHGTPGSRYQRYFDEAAYGRAGFRAIIFDRPGYGRSTRVRGRTVSDSVRDIVIVADALGVGRFVVCGWSGGTTNALAAAALLGDRVIASAPIMPRAPRELVDFDFYAGMDDVALRGARATEGGLAALEAHYGPLMGSLLAALADGKVPFPAPPPAIPVAQQFLPEAFAQGTAGVVDDCLSGYPSWGFDPSSIQRPTAIWAASDDTTCPFRHAQWLANRIPAATLGTLQGGHLGFLPVYERILNELAALAR